MPRKTKEDILFAAKKAFGRFGYKKTTMEDIARELGLTSPAIYKYFRSKEELFKECIRTEAKKLMEKVEKEVRKANSPEEKLKTFVKEKLKNIQDTLELFSVSRDIAVELKREVDSIKDSEITEAEANFITQIIQEGIKKGRFRNVQPDKASFIIQAISNQVLEKMGEWDMKEIDKLIDIVINGLRKDKN